VDITRYQYPFEDSLIVTIRFNADNQTTNFDKFKLVKIKKNYLAQTISNDFENKKSSLKNKLNEIKNKGGRIALFGAGHLTIKTLNFYDIGHLVEFVVDDNPHKVGKFIPGSGIKIHPTSSLMDHDITFCLSTLNPESEIKVRAKFADYFANGAQLISVFNLG